MKGELNTFNTNKQILITLRGTKRCRSKKKFPRTSSSTKQIESNRSTVPHKKKLQRVYVSAIKALTGKDLSSYATDYFNLVDKLIANKGMPGAILRLKAIHNAAINSMLKQPNPEHPYLAVDGDGFPTIFKRLKKVGKTPAGIQAVNSLLSYYRCLRAPIQPDFTSIVTPGKEISDDLISELLSVVPRKWHFDLEELPQPRIAFKSSGGPNGQATLGAAKDIAALSESLCDSIIYIAEAQSGDDFVEAFEELRDLAYNDDQAPTASRLGVSPEGGGKSRIFAICDYWTQLVLKPLHSQLASLLKLQASDCTFNQSAGVPVIKQWTQERNDLFSFDLTAASDRIPISLQERLLGLLTGNTEYAEHWRNLMTNRGFRYRRKYYTWAVGQPLGAYSSWPSFTLAHHLMVRLAAKRAGTKAEYFMLGDDIVIAGTATANEYRLILGQLGVDINYTKSLVQTNAVEFAKRHFTQGVEVSSFPVNLTDSLVRDPHLIGEFVNHLVERSSITISPVSIDTFLQTVSLVSDVDYKKLQIISGNPITGRKALLPDQASDTAHTQYGVCGHELIWPALDEKLYQALYAVLKYKYIVREYSLLQRGRENYYSQIQLIRLPGIDPVHCHAHPIRLCMEERYCYQSNLAHQSIGKFWSQPEISRAVLPSVHSPSLKELTPTFLGRIKHEAKVILELYSAANSLQQFIQDNFGEERPCEHSPSYIIAQWAKSSQREPSGRNTDGLS